MSIFDLLPAEAVVQVFIENKNKLTGPITDEMLGDIVDYGLPLVKVLYDHPSINKAMLARTAVELSKREILNWLHENQPNGLSHGTDVCCNMAAFNGDIELLKWLRERNNPWSEGTCCAAINGRNLHVLSYLLENGCPCDSRSAWEAASVGHIPSLKMLQANGIKLDAQCLVQAATNKKQKCVEYLVEQKCPGYDKVSQLGY